MATEYTVTYGTSTGTFGSGNWVKYWKSTATDPYLEINVNANNIQASTGNMYSGQSLTATYTLVAQTGYKITGYTLTGTALSSNQTLTPAAGGSAVVFEPSVENTLSVSGISLNSTSFTQAGGNNGLQVTSFTITIEDDPAALIMEEINTKVVANLFTMQTMYGIEGSDKIYTESSDASEGNIPALLDNDYSTFHHSDWHGSAATPHWVTYELTDATDAVRFYIKQRSTGTGRPTNVTVSASNDNSTFTEITTLSSMTWAGSPLDYYSTAVTASESYKYWRFTVNATNSTTNSWFCASEWYVLPNNDVVNTLFDAENQYRAGTVTDETTAQALLNNVDAAITDLNSTTVTVTYELYESDGTTLVSSEAVVQGKNSAVSVPTSMVSTYYDNTVSGTIGTSDCTITVVRTLKAGIVGDLADLSNNKAYTIVVPRGTYTTDNGSLANTVKSSSYAINNFALISYESNYYMWSVADSKFVAGSGATLGDTPVAIEFVANTTPAFQIKSGSLYLNATSGFDTGGGFDSWSTADDGNRCVIYEAADFDPTAVLQALEDYFHPTNLYSAVESEILPYIFADPTSPATSAEAASLGTYFGLSVAAATEIVSTYGSQIAAQNFTQEEYDAAKAIFDAGIIYPASGTYRIKSMGARTGETYISYGYSADKSTYGLVTVAATNKLTDAGTVFTLTATGTTGVYTLSTQGLNVQDETAYNQPFSATTDAAVAFTFETVEPGVVAIRANTADSYAYLHESAWATPAGVVRWVATGQASRWTIEDADEMTLSLNAGPDGVNYATFAAPFDVTLPSTVTAYTLTLDEGRGVAEVTSLGQEIPAGTAVLLKSDSETSVTAGVSYDEFAPFSGSNALEGTYVTISTLADNQLALGVVDSKVGFYKYTYALGANKAYLNVPASSSARAFVLSFDEGEVTGINAVNAAAQNGAAVYDLQGRRVSNATKGVYIVNGKKVLVK